MRSSLARLQEDLRRADDSLARLLGQWQPRADGEPEQPIEYWQGHEAQARRLYELEYSARTSLLVFQSGANTVAPVPSTLVTPTPTPTPDDGPEPALRKDGNPTAAYRVVVDRDFLSEPAALHALDERLAAGHQVRVVDQPLIKLVVADGETAMVQVEGAGRWCWGRPWCCWPSSCSKRCGGARARICGRTAI